MCKNLYLLSDFLEATEERPVCPASREALADLLEEQIAAIERLRGALCPDIEELEPSAELAN